MNRIFINLTFALVTDIKVLFFFTLPNNIHFNPIKFRNPFFEYLIDKVTNVDFFELEILI